MKINNTKTFLASRVLILIAVFVCSQVIIGYFIVRHAYLLEIKSTLSRTMNTIINDSLYKDGKWNLDAYNSDPDTPSPVASSDFPLYIFTTEGYVIERSKPIWDFYDASDLQYILNFQTPQTITSPTNESWRVLAKAVAHEGGTAAGIYVAKYNPDKDTVNIDNLLKTTIDKIYSQVSLNNGEIDTSKVNNKDIPYNISFRIVSKYNKIILSNGRAPTFIDTSYVESLIGKLGYQIVLDGKTNAPHMVSIAPLNDDKGQIQGIIVVGREIKPLYSTLNKYIMYWLIIGPFILFSLTLILKIFVLDKAIKLSQEYHSKNTNESNIYKLSFDRTNSQIIIDSTSIKIPYDSNQYYLCDAIFSSPSKRWEADELLEKFGTEFVGKRSVRKIYDATLTVNKKVKFNLIEYKGKTYRLNQKLVSKIVK